LLAALGIDLIQATPSLPTTTSAATRREWRINQATNQLRGVSIRERNSGRKQVGWISKKTGGWSEILAEFDRWKRNAQHDVGGFE